MTGADAILALDLGTHKCRAVVMGGDGHVLARAVSPNYPTYRDHPGWAEQEPEDWWTAAVACIRAVLREVDIRAIRALVPVGHAPSHLPVDSDGRPLGRSLIWQDSRARAEADWIATHTTVDERFRALGLHLPMAANMGPSKLLWLRDHEPDRYARTAAIIQPKDYLILRLTGEILSDRYGHKDIIHAETGEFDPWYAGVLGLKRSLVPRVIAGWEIAGKTNATQAAETGLPAGLPVAAGTGDAFSGLIGAGGEDEGDISDVSGTSEIIGIVRDAPPKPVEAFLSYPLPRAAGSNEPRSVTFAATRAAGDSIDWFARRVAGATDVGTWLAGFAERIARADSDGHAPRSVLFWPYLDGERSPLWDADARGMFFGMDLATDTDTLARAVFEGVAFSIRHNLELLAERTGCAPRRMWVGGGTSRSAFFNEIKADLTGLDVLVPEEYEATARGGAAMAFVALGMAPDVPAAVRRLIGKPSVIRPRSERRAHYDRLMPIYREITAAMRPMFAALAAARNAV